MDEQILRNRRTHERFSLQPMYTTLLAKRGDGAAESELSGHIYDISETGMRMELDEGLAAGERVEVQIGLPGVLEPIRAAGDVVWTHSQDDDPGPTRMALQFTDFARQSDQDRLNGYLRHQLMRQAA